MKGEGFARLGASARIGPGVAKYLLCSSLERKSWYKSDVLRKDKVLWFQAGQGTLFLSLSVCHPVPEIKAHFLNQLGHFNSCMPACAIGGTHLDMA